MALSCGKQMLVCLSVIFNSIFFLCGLGMIAFASYLLYSVQTTFPDMTIHEYGIVIAFLVVGLVVCIISFFGCCGAATGNVCMLTTFAVLIVIIFILDIAAVVLGFMYKDKIPGFIRETVTAEFEKAKAGNNRTMEAIESFFACCGVDGPSDYGTNIPESCDANDVGCDAKIQDLLIRYSVILLLIAIAIAVFTLITIISAACLISIIKTYVSV